MIQPDRLALGEHQPLEAVAATAVEILGTLAGEVGAQVGHRRLLQRLVTADRGLGAPAMEQGGVGGQRRAQRDTNGEREG